MIPEAGPADDLGRRHGGRALARGIRPRPLRAARVRTLVAGSPLPRRACGERGVEAFEPLRAEEHRRVRGCPLEGAESLPQADEPVAQAEPGRGVGDADDRPPLVGQGAEEVHHVGLGAGIETRRGFVEEDQARIPEQLDREPDPLPLSAGEPPDRHGGAVAEPDAIQSRRDEPTARLAPGQPLERCRVAERGARRQRLVDDDVLRQIGDPPLAAQAGGRGGDAVEQQAPAREP